MLTIIWYIRLGTSNTPEQRILELEAKVKLLEKQKARAEYLAERADKKVIIFDMFVDMAEKEYEHPNQKKPHNRVIDFYREEHKEKLGFYPRFTRCK